VDQIFIGPTFNQANGNTICTHQTDATAWCMGYNNTWGQFGNGTTGSSASFVQWGLPNLVAMGTGTWDQFCVLDTAGNVYCAGNGFAPSPVLEGGSGPHSSFWVTTFGSVLIDDTTVLRAVESRTECRISPSGLTCPGLSSPLGPAGHVVMGGLIQGLPDGPPGPPPPGRDPTCSMLMGAACWLTDEGIVQCATCTNTGLQTKSYFGNGTVLDLGLNAYGNNLCAVYGDGSLWCMGSNTNGMLGTGDANPRSSPTQVQPPGSVRTKCQ